MNLSDECLSTKSRSGVNFLSENVNVHISSEISVL
jgi:hypothetical protein